MLVTFGLFHWDCQVDVVECWFEGAFVGQAIGLLISIGLVVTFDPFEVSRGRTSAEMVGCCLEPFFIGDIYPAPVFPGLGVVGETV